MVDGPNEAQVISQPQTIDFVPKETSNLIGILMRGNGELGPDPHTPQGVENERYNLQVLLSRRHTYPKKIKCTRFTTLEFRLPKVP